MATNHVTDDIEVLFFDTGAPRAGDVRALALAAGEQLGSRNAAQPRRRQGALVASAGAARRIGSSPTRSGAKVRRRSSPRPAIATGVCRSRRIRSCIARRCWSSAIGPRDCDSWRRARARSRSRSAAGARRSLAGERLRRAAGGLRVRRAREARGRRVVAEAHASLGGDNALRPLPKQTPVRLVVLWTVLIVGVGVLVAMALVLLKRVRRRL